MGFAAAVTDMNILYEYSSVHGATVVATMATTELPAFNTDFLESPDYFRRVERSIVWGKSGINRHNRTFQNGIIP